MNSGYLCVRFHVAQISGKMLSEMNYSCWSPGWWAGLKYLAMSRQPWGWAGLAALLINLKRTEMKAEFIRKISRWKKEKNMRYYIASDILVSSLKKYLMPMTAKHAAIVENTTNLSIKKLVGTFKTITQYNTRRYIIVQANGEWKNTINSSLRSYRADQKHRIWVNTYHRITSSPSSVRSYGLPPVSAHKRESAQKTSN